MSIGLALQALLAVLPRAREPQPADLESALQVLPEVGTLPSPWETWTLIGLARHRTRQAWVAGIIRDRLQGDLRKIAAMGWLGHPEGVPRRGPVPGFPEWEYSFHGCGCCIRHKVAGDAIDVDFFGETAEYFDTFFYKNYLESLRRPEPPEQRLRELHPSAPSISIAIAELLAIGGLSPLSDGASHPYRVSDDVVVVEDAGAIDDLCDVWSDTEDRVWMAAVLGDWLAADDAAAGRPELAAITGPRAAECREIRRVGLCRDLSDPHRAAEALRALAALQSPDLDQHLEEALRGPPSGTVSAALEVIGEQNDRRWCRPLQALVSRIDPSGPPPQPHIWMTSLKFLLGHGHDRDSVLSALARAGGTEIGEAVLVALEHAPALALPLIRKALLSSIPMNRTAVAATLAVINAPWSQRELLRALAGTDDQDQSADVRAALLECNDEQLRRAVLAWEQRNPHEPELGSYVEVDGDTRGPFLTFGEQAILNRASRIKFEMDSLHDRVMKVKSVVPPEPRPWWRFW